MTDIYTIQHNSFGTRGSPWIEEFSSGVRVRKCEACNRNISEPTPNATLTAKLDLRKGSFWPDSIGAGHLSIFVVSYKFIVAWKNTFRSSLLAHPVIFAPPLPKQLAGSPAPEYFWIDGRNLPHAKLNFSASGYVDMSLCNSCGSQTYNVGATYDAQRQPGVGFAFSEVPAGAELFVSDLSEHQFFCRSAVVQMIEVLKLSNFRCVSISDGYSH